MTGDDDNGARRPRFSSDGGRPAPRRPSILDVANHSGVSHQTVSRVLNKHPNVREATRARVLEAMEELGYRPNPAARALASGKSKTLGVATLDSSLYGPVSTLQAVQEAAQHHGYLVSTVSVPVLDRHSLRDALRRLTAQSLDGIIVITPYSSARDSLAHVPTGIPVVAVEGDPAGDHPVVTVDQLNGARLATEHLLAQGHSTVSHIAGPADWIDAAARVEGWRCALEDAGAQLSLPMGGDWSAQSGFRAGQVLARDPEVTAIFAANDNMALGLLMALHERGRRVPEDVAVVGFDDTPESAYFLPPLTTVRQDFQRLGEAAVHSLLEMLGTGAASSQQVVIEPSLVLRQSSGVRRSGSPRRALTLASVNKPPRRAAGSRRRT